MTGVRRFSSRNTEIRQYSLTTPTTACCCSTGRKSKHFAFYSLDSTSPLAEYQCELATSGSDAAGWGALGTTGTQGQAPAGVAACDPGWDSQVARFRSNGLYSTKAACPWISTMVTENSAPNASVSLSGLPSRKETGCCLPSSIATLSAYR